MYYYHYRRRRRNPWVALVVALLSVSIGTVGALFWRPIWGAIQGAGDLATDGVRSIRYALSSQASMSWDSPHAIESMPPGLKYTLLGIAFVSAVLLVTWGMGTGQRSG